MPVLTGGQVLDREGTTVMPCDGGALLEGGQYNIGDHGLIEEAEEPVMGMGPYKYSGVPADGYKNGIAEKGAYLVDILTGDTYRNTGTKAATVWTADAPSGGGSGLLTASGQLIDAQIKTLPNYPTGYIELVTAPGSDKLLSFHRAYLLVDLRGGNYTNITDDLDLTNSGLTISYGNDASQASMVARAQMLGAGGLVGVHLLPYVNTDATRDPKVQAYHQAGDPLPFANLPLKLVGYNADGPFADGHADNTLSWKIWYSLDDAVPFGA
jgi:hypothetical protein